MQNGLVKNWFGERFNQLHPLLQQLHVQGSKLAGDVEVSYGEGFAGIIGSRLAKKMNLPGEGVHHLTVCIAHQKDGLHWDRTFNDGEIMKSLFKPVGNIGHGYWIETTGPLTMQLTVDIKNGGWYWRCLKVRFLSFRIPVWLMPTLKAYKVIENDMYRFCVEFSLPAIGSLVSYQGLLNTVDE